jgi:hypothetical protein
MVWQKAYDSPSSGLDSLKSFQKTSDNGFIAAGSTSGPGGTTLWILKLNNSGDIIWQKSYFDIDDYPDNKYFIQQTSDGGFIVSGKGRTEAPWLLRLDENGDAVWRKTYGNNQAKAYSVQEASDQGFIVVGSIQGDHWVLKLDSIGNVIWQNAYDNDGAREWANAVAKSICLFYVFS